MKKVNVDISVDYITGTDDQKEHGFEGYFQLNVRKPGSEDVLAMVELSETEFAELSEWFEVSIEDVREE